MDELPEIDEQAIINDLKWHEKTLESFFIWC